MKSRRGIDANHTNWARGNTRVTATVVSSMEKHSSVYGKTIATNFKRGTTFLFLHVHKIARGQALYRGHVTLITPSR